MATLQTVMEKLSDTPQAWERIRADLARATNPRARFVELAQEHGLTVDQDELDRILAKAASELSEQDLDSVSGGFNPQPDPPGNVMNGFAAQKVLIGLLVPAVQKVRG